MFLFLFIQCLLNSKLNSKQQNVFALSVKNPIVKKRKRKMKCLDLNVLEKCSGNQSRCFQFLPHFSTPSGSKYLMCFKPFSLFFARKQHFNYHPPFIPTFSINPAFIVYFQTFTICNCFSKFHSFFELNAELVWRQNLFKQLLLEQKTFKQTPYL